MDDKHLRSLTHDTVELHSNRLHTVNTNTYENIRRINFVLKNVPMPGFEPGSYG